MSFRNYSHLWTNPARLDIAGCFREGLGLFLTSPGISIGFTVVAVIVAVLALLFASIVPLLGNIATTTIHLSLAGGFFVSGYKLYRKEKVTLSDCFSGFNKLGQLVLVALIMYGFLILIFIPLGTGAFFMMDAGGSDNNLAEYLYAYYAGLIAFVLIVSFLATIVYLFALPNIIHLNLKAWDAMELSRRVILKSFGSVSLLVLLVYLVNVAGTMLFGLGLLISVPVSFYVVQVAWEQLIGKHAVPHFDQLIDELGNDKPGGIFAE